MIKLREQITDEQESVWERDLLRELIFREANEIANSHVHKTTPSSLELDPVNQELANLREEMDVLTAMYRHEWVMWNEEKKVLEKKASEQLDFAFDPEEYNQRWNEAMHRTQASIQEIWREVKQLELKATALEVVE